MKKTKVASDHEQIKSALRKKAFGYKTEEVVEEYGEKEGEFNLLKRKVTIKDVAPDLSALKAYMDYENDNVYEKLSTEELEKEKERLLIELAQKRSKNETNQTN